MDRRRRRLPQERLPNRGRCLSSVCVSHSLLRLHLEVSCDICLGFTITCDTDTVRANGCSILPIHHWWCWLHSICTLLILICLPRISERISVARFPQLIGFALPIDTPSLSVCARDAQLSSRPFEWACFGWRGPRGRSVSRRCILKQ